MKTLGVKVKGIISSATSFPRDIVKLVGIAFTPVSRSAVTNAQRCRHSKPASMIWDTPYRASFPNRLAQRIKNFDFHV